MDFRDRLVHTKIVPLSAQARLINLLLLAGGWSLVSGLWLVSLTAMHPVCACASHMPYLASGSPVLGVLTYIPFTFTNVRTYSGTRTKERMAAWSLHGHMGLHGCMEFAWADVPGWVLHGQVGLHGSNQSITASRPHYLI